MIHLWFVRNHYEITRVGNLENNILTQQQSDSIVALTKNNFPRKSVVSSQPFYYQSTNGVCYLHNYVFSWFLCFFFSCPSIWKDIRLHYRSFLLHLRLGPSSSNSNVNKVWLPYMERCSQLYPATSTVTWLLVLKFSHASPTSTDRRHLTCQFLSYYDSDSTAFLRMTKAQYIRSYFQSRPWLHKRFIGLIYV